MITYVLLVMMLTPTNAATSTLAAAEFNSLRNCESAATIAKAAFNGSSSALFYICVPK